MFQGEKKVYIFKVSPLGMMACLMPIRSLNCIFQKTLFSVALLQVIICMEDLGPCVTAHKCAFATGCVIGL